MILYINTVERGKIEFALINSSDRAELDQVFLLRRRVGIMQSEKALFLLDSFSKKNKIKLSNIKKIIVNRGPGSFTSVRLGIVLANTLAYGLRIPIIGVDNIELHKKEDYLKLSKLKFLPTGQAGSKNFIKPYYYKEPDITKNKKLDKILNKS